MVSIKAIAKVCHEANRAYCESMGDLSQKVWEQCSDDHRASLAKGVEQILKKPNITPEENHALWMARKESEGWTYGEKKDVENKKHPCLVPYDQLPQEQQAKDYLFRSICRSLLPFYTPPVEDDRPDE